MGVGRTVYKGEVKTGVFAWFLSLFDQNLRILSTVGASMLAMEVNDNVGCLTPSGVRPTIASMLAPTNMGKGVTAKLTQIDGD